MSARPSQIAAHAASLVLVLAVGILIGQQFCVPDIEEPEPEELECPTSPPRIVEYCPPEPEPEPEIKSVEEPPPPPREVETTGEALPDGPPPATAEQRQLLLGWARDQSTTLQGCPRDRGHTYRLAITVGLDDDGNIDDVSINNADEDLSAELDACIQQRIEQWELPDDLKPSQRQLVFQLTL